MCAASVGVSVGAPQKSKTSLQKQVTVRARPRLSRNIPLADGTVFTAALFTVALREPPRHPSTTNKENVCTRNETFFGQENRKPWHVQENKWVELRSHCRKTTTAHSHPIPPEDQVRRGNRGTSGRPSYGRAGRKGMYGIRVV